MTGSERSLVGLRFMRLGMLALAAGMFFGVIGGFQFLFPDFLQELLFTKTRPLHVSLVVSWIFLIAIGGIYFYLPRQCRYTLWSERAATTHFWVFLITGLAIIACYLSGRFGGREYFEFPPILSATDISGLDTVWYQLLHDDPPGEGTMARLLLDVGHGYRLFLYHLHRSTPLPDSVLPRLNGPRDHGAVEVLRCADWLVEHARLRHGPVSRDAHFRTATNTRAPRWHLDCTSLAFLT